MAFQKIMAVTIEKIKLVLFWSVLLLVIPLAFLVITESFLRVMDIGPNLDLLEAHPTNPDLLLANPEVARRYFPANDLPSFGTSDALSKIKDDSTIRIIALGGSTTAGYPYFYNGSFPALLKLRLAEVYPGYRIEMFNLGMTAINSFTVLDFTRDIIHYEPDLLVIYTGHNEFYGALGSSSTRSASGSIAIIRAYQFFAKYRLFILLKDVLTIRPQAKFASRGETRMARMVANTAIPLGSTSYNRTVENFTRNITDILNLARKYDVPVVLGTLASNLRDLSPFISCSAQPGTSVIIDSLLAIGYGWLASGDLIGAREQAQAALALDSLYAASWFMSGKVWLATGEVKDSQMAFSWARDLDCLRFRASSDINYRIRDMARRDGVYLADVESLMNHVAEHNVIGSDLMLEHLHPTLSGAHHISQIFAEAIIKLQVLATGLQAAPLPGIKYFLDRDGVTSLDFKIAGFQMQTLLSDWPFSNDGQAIRLDELPRSTFMDSIAVATLADKLNYWEAHTAMAEWFGRNGSVDAQLAEYRAILIAFPHERNSYQQLSWALIKAGQLEQALPVLRQAHAIQIDAFTSKWIGTIHLSAGRSETGLPYLELAKQLDSTDLQTRYNLSGAYYQAGEVTKALEQLESVLTSDSDFPKAREFYDQIRLTDESGADRSHNF